MTTRDAAGTAAAFLPVAERIADAAAAVAMRYYRSRVAADAKPDSTPVTIADRETEVAMRQVLAREAPDHGIYGEEHGRERPEAKLVWVLDPIDGTKAFVIGRPLFGSLIALTRDGHPILGVIDCPALGERWIGAAGRPTVFNGMPARTRACADLSQAWAATTTPDMFAGPEDAAFRRLARAVRHVVYGGDCHSVGLLASGFLDLVIEADTKPYDFCALVPVVAGAGGVITDWSGAPLTVESDGRLLIAGDPGLHERALGLLNGR
jgi:inositol-phosphate phosphatase / L-galactose 1-phosphate phosphatase / histidinol-phosphatase